MNLKNSQIMITGGTGFLGTNLRNTLIAYGVSQENILAVGSEPNLTDRESSLPLFLNKDIIFHLAANVGGIGKHTRDPAKLLYDNIMITTNVIDLAADKGVKKLVLVGTACSYPENAPVPLKEEEIWNGYPAKETAPYGWAKRLMMVQAQTYREQYGLDSITLIPTNIYGKYDHFESEDAHVIPALISRISKAKDSNAKEVAIWGDGTATREFIYAEDVAEALILAAEIYNKPDPVNIGTGIETKIDELVDMLCQIIGYTGKIKWDASKPTGSRRRQMDVSKAWQEFGFKASTGLRDGLKKTIDHWNRKVSI